MTDSYLLEDFAEYRDDARARLFRIWIYSFVPQTSAVSLERSCKSILQKGEGKEDLQLLSAFCGELRGRPHLISR